MTTKKKGLGRGLSALLDDPATDITTSSGNSDQPTTGHGPLATRSSSPIGMIKAQPLSAFK